MTDLAPLVFAAAVFIAFGIDHYCGEPPVRYHPVVWMGSYLNWIAPHILAPMHCFPPNPRDLKAFSLGAIAWCVGAAFVLMAAWALQWAVLQLPAVLAALLMGLALKPLLAWAMLRREVQAVEEALGESLAAGRERLSWLVSRDTDNLSESEVRESAIESLAENLNDSVVAPIFWFVLLGLPGAAIYRFANTADAMWGYRGEWEWAGKWAARADDVLSWLPARLTAALMWLVAGDFRLATLRREAAQTPSPNSGWPMAAMALALGVCLRKRGVYTLNAEGRAVRAIDTRQALGIASKVTLVLAVFALPATLLMVFGVA